MDKGLMIRGFYRINKLMQSMIDCEEKQELIRLGNIFIDDTQELLSLIYVKNEINDEDLEEFKQGIADIEKDAMAELNDGEVEETVTAVEGEEPVAVPEAPGQ